MIDLKSRGALSPTQRVLAAINAGGMGLSAIAQATNLSVEKVRNCLRQMERDGVIESALENRPIRVWRLKCASDEDRPSTTPREKD